MADIKTQCQPDHDLELEVSVRTEFVHIESFKKTDLEAWLAKLPSNARVKFTGISSGKIILVSTWKERRNG